jgi:hypothetical protein
MAMHIPFALQPYLAHFHAAAAGSVPQRTFCDIFTRSNFFAPHSIAIASPLVDNMPRTRRHFFRAAVYLITKARLIDETTYCSIVVL